MFSGVHSSKPQYQMLIALEIVLPLPLDTNSTSAALSSQCIHKSSQTHWACKERKEDDTGLIKQNISNIHCNTTIQIIYDDNSREPADNTHPV